ncbi:MAG: glycosyltransferase family 4 protein [Leptolyngbyaceae cyanobacterium bins.302]|nr:glycosyltransferase family 4 protein [Leptolyngbyaceae cyanobacterium bins.302]
MTKKLKVLYVAGPGNVIQTFEYWRNGEDDPSQVSMTFSGQFYDVCSELGAEGYIIASHSDRKFVKDGQFTLEHRPVPLRNQSGVLYYLGQVLYQLSIVLSALRFRANIVVEGDTDCYFVLALLPRLGIQVVPTLHCVLWAKYLPVSQLKKLLFKANSQFFARDCLAILSTSDDINEQVQQIANKHPRPIVNFLSTYRRNEFEQVSPPNFENTPFQVLFAGRIEVDKGVLDLIEIARRYRSQGRNDIVFNICGTGSAFDLLRKKMVEYELHSSFILHGYCNKPKMREMFNAAHVVIVPTKSSFVEGLNQVVIEGILANRPVITSSICPALSYVHEAVVEVPPDDIQAYSDAILKLQGDRAFYEEKQRSCKRLQEQFYSAGRSWGEALKSVLRQLQSIPQKAATTYQRV